VLSGTSFDLTIGCNADELLPGKCEPPCDGQRLASRPILRWREGTTVDLRVSNALPADSIHGPEASIHWHGILLPANMDGVPGLSFNGIIAARPTLPLRRAPGGHLLVPQPLGLPGTGGLYGPLVIEPREPEPSVRPRIRVMLSTGPI
jgi:FtsP/CotA-like multicopper oxidase with cupredoxin domain